LLPEIKERYQLPEVTQVVSRYEAVRDGFWLHRNLIAVPGYNQEFSLLRQRVLI
jgi:hypothetical protein